MTTTVLLPTSCKMREASYLLLSSSMTVSYTHLDVYKRQGQRMALTCISDKLFDRQFPALAERYKDAGVFGPPPVSYTHLIMTVA